MISISFHCSKADRSIFIHHSYFGIVILAVYVDGILLKSSDRRGIDEAKAYLKSQFVIKDLRRPNTSLAK